MGKRSQPRKEVQVPVRIFGTDRPGPVFSEKVVTVNISRLGVELAEVDLNLTADEIIGLTYGNNRAHFRVKWVGAPDTPKAGHVGLLSTAPEKQLWDFPLAPRPPPTITGRAYREAQARPVSLSELDRDSHRQRHVFLGNCGRSQPWRMLRRDADPVCSQGPS